MAVSQAWLGERARFRIGRVFRRSFSLPGSRNQAVARVAGLGVSSAEGFVNGFSDPRSFREMWQAMTWRERVLFIGAPAVLVFAVMVGGA